MLSKDTEVVNIASRTTSKIIIGNQNYAVYVFKESNYQVEAAPYDIPRSEWGKTVTLNYQFIKQ